jgi:hypothetical protein
LSGVVEERMAETEASSLCLRFDWRAVYYVRRLLGDEQRDESERLDLDRTREKEPSLSLMGTLQAVVAVIRSMTAEAPRYRETV